MIYPIDFPSQSPTTERLILNRRQSITESPYTYRTQTVHTASQWMLEWTWPQMPHAKAERVYGWLQSLKGAIGTFRYAPRQPVAFTTGFTTLTFNAYATSDTISVSGFVPSGATSLRIGQYMQIGDQLLQIVSAPATADVNGVATVSIEPELRRDFPAGFPVNLRNPAGVFRLASSDGVGFTLDPDRLPTFGTIQSREAI